MPFGVDTSFGFAAAYIIQWAGSGVICAIIYTINSCFFGICWYIEALLFDLNSIFDLLDAVYGNKNGTNNNNHRLSVEEYVNLRTNLHKFIKLHTRIIRCVS